MRLKELYGLFDEISKGALDMRIGTTLTFFVIILIAFGFVLSDNLQVRQEVTELETGLLEQSQQVEQLQVKLTACDSTVLENQQTIAQRENAITALNEKILERENEIAALQAINSQMLGQIGELEARNRDLEAQIVESEQTDNNGQVEEKNITFQGIGSILLVIILIAQIALNLALNSRWRLQPSKKQDKSEYVRLTPAERSLIARNRRNQRA